MSDSEPSPRDGIVAFLLLALTATAVWFAATGPTDEHVEMARSEGFAAGLQQGAANAAAQAPETSETGGGEMLGGDGALVWRHVDFTTDLYGVRYAGNTENLIDWLILFFGAHEKHILFFLRDTMGRIAPDGGVFVDVGANSGQHSLFMSRHSKTVHAIEPYDRVLKRFRGMIDVNGITNIIIHPVGLGDSPGEIPFFAPPEINQGIGSFLPEYNTTNTPSSVAPIVTGDSLFAGAEPVGLDLVKMDIEGYEKLALKGLTETLTASRPVVVMELTIRHDLEVGFKSEAEIRGVLPPDYEIFVFEDTGADAALGGLWSLVPFALDFNEQGAFDLVFVPKEKKDRILLKSTEADSRPTRERPE